MQYEGLKKFSVFRQAEKKLRLRAALARWATQALLLLLALILLHSLIALPPAGRYFLLASALLFLLYSWLKHVQRPLADRFFHPNHPSLNSIALRIGRDYPELKDRLANALQISARASPLYWTGLICRVILTASPPAAGCGGWLLRPRSSSSSGCSFLKLS